MAAQGKSYFVIFLLFIHLSLSATEYSPWLGNVLEPTVEGKVWLNGYRSVATGHGTRHRGACDLFFELDASIAYKEYLAFEFEAIATKTRRHCFGMDSLLLTARYRWWNDIVGDPLTVTTGLTVSKVFKHALHDIAAFHHGGIQLEGHVAAGKELSCQEFWISRIWGVFAVGIADLGSPWIRGDIAWEHNWFDRHQVKIFADTLWGLGHNNLNLHKHFKGYGPIRHQSIDLGLRYSLGLPHGIFIRAEYAYRVFARNCPKNVSHFLISVFYPIGL